jgi:hypothetical protein
VITLKRFRRIERAVRRAGHGRDIEWAEQLSGPADADAFALAAVYVIVNSGMSWKVAQPIYERCSRALQTHGRVGRVFRHPGKVRAIRSIWQHRHELYEEFRRADDPVAFCETLPWIGPTTKWHLAKDLGTDVGKPDVHLARLARRDRTTVERLCRWLARGTGYRVATIDTILWRACATGILNSKRYEEQGWRAAFNGKATIQH